MLAVHFPLRFLSAADFASFGCGPPQDFLYGARFKGGHLAKQVELDSCEIRFLCWVIFMLFFRVTPKIKTGQRTDPLAIKQFAMDNHHL